MAEKTEIRFGTDGWRGIISRDFTFENVRWVTQAVVDYLKEQGIADKGLVVGYDRRFLSKEYAEEVAGVAAANGVKVLLGDGYAPTPAISWAVKKREMAGGIMVTASHNPPAYNGLKFKEDFGGSALPETTAAVEDMLHARQASGEEPLFISYNEGVDKGLIETFDPLEDYIEKLKSFVDFDMIKGCGFRVAVDPMYGTGARWISRLLREAGLEVKEIRAEENPGFKGISPEPIDKNLQPLMSLVKEEGFDVGLATDGDADRIGAVDGRGEFFNSHRILTLLLRHMVEVRGLRGDIIKTVSGTRMIDKLAEKYNITCHETPIGFKHICKKMLEGDILLGGEESGGIGITSYLPERDGILIALLLVEIMAYNGKRLEAVLDDIFDEIGVFCYDRVDLQIEKTRMDTLRTRLNSFSPKELAGFKVTSENRMDGSKFILEDGSWLLIRPSGTEPVLRIYAEASTPEKVSALLEEGQRLVEM
jgi:alpha-D-glucose phosphate-specific phosphoglucomutase